MQPTDVILDVITSVFGGARFLPHWLSEITRQTLFQRTHHYILDNNPDDRDREILETFAARHPNVTLLRDPVRHTMYTNWASLCRAGSAPYITNWNIDDLRHRRYNETHVAALEQNPGMHLAYCEHLMTEVENETWDRNSSGGKVFSPFAYREKVDHLPPYSRETMVTQSLVHCGPVWRRSVHAVAGHFNGAYFASGDWEFFSRLAVVHNLDFLFLPKPLGLYYWNPRGVSTNPTGRAKARTDYEYHTILARNRVFFDNSLGPVDGGHLGLPVHGIEETPQAVDAAVRCAENLYRPATP